MAIHGNSPLAPDDPNATFQIIPSNGMVAGETLSSWTQDWWRLMVQEPDSTLGDPNWDQNGAFEASQPASGMFFLAGSWGNDPQTGSERFITTHVQEGTPVLVPILDLISSQWQSDKKNFDNVSLKDWKTDVQKLFLTIDGHDVANLQADLVRTTGFSAGPAVSGTVGAVLADPATGNVETLKSIGYFAAVTLSAGNHTIEFGGNTSNYSVRVIDHLTVG